MYQITIKEVVEFPEMKTAYEHINGTRYYSQYAAEIESGKVNVDYVVKEYPTGKTLQRETVVYSQQFEAEGLSSIIKAVNNIK